MSAEEKMRYDQENMVFQNTVTTSADVYTQRNGKLTIKPKPKGFLSKHVKKQERLRSLNVHPLMAERLFPHRESLLGLFQKFGDKWNEVRDVYIKNPTLTLLPDQLNGPTIATLPKDLQRAAEKINRKWEAVRGYNSQIYKLTSKVAGEVKKKDGQDIAPIAILFP